MMFTFLHEKAHESISKNSGESTKEYETRINNEAMRRMESEYGIVMPRLESSTEQSTPQPVQETSTPVEVPAIEMEKQPIPNRPDAQYLSGLDGSTFNTTDSSPEGAYFRIYDIDGDTAKYEYSGEDDYAIARRVVNNNNAEIVGSLRTASFINTEKAGTVKRNSDGSWTIVEKASIILGPTRAAKEASAPIRKGAKRGGMQVNTAASPLTFKLISQKEYQDNPNKFTQEVDRVVRLIENKLKFKSRAFFGKVTDKFISRGEYLQNAFRELLDNIGIPNNIETLEQLKKGLDNGTIIKQIKDRYSEYKEAADNAKSNLDSVNANINTLNSFLRVQDVSKYSQKQQKLIKDTFPALFGDLGNFKSEKQALSFYRRQMKSDAFLNSKVNLGFTKMQYFTSQSRLGKVETLLNYHTLSPEDFNSRIYKVVDNEMSRRAEFFNSPKMKEALLARKEREAIQAYERSVKGILERFAKDGNTISGKLAKAFLAHPKTLSAIKSERIVKTKFALPGGF